jgi:flagellar basal-body rod modification protein FlgD
MSSSTPPVSSGSSSTSNSASSAALSSALNISPADFLQLISTQMQDQNPLQPTDPTQFLSQLEQMSEVASMQSMQGSLTSLQTSLQSSQMANGTALLGQTVLAPSTTATLTSSGQTITGAFEPPSGAKSITVTVTDSAGSLVDTFNVTPASSGLTNFTWNGANSSGSAVAAGTYTIAATAGDGSSNQTLTPYIASKVESVTVDPTTQALDLNTNNGTVPLSGVVSIL